jgi:hypothetical protein
MPPELLLRTILEGTTPRCRFAVTDETGGVVPPSALSALTLTYYDVRSEAIINSRDTQPALNQNGVTMDTQGVVRWQLVPGDSVLIHAQPDIEPHRALFTFTTTDLRVFRKYLELHIERLPVT